MRVLHHGRRWWCPPHIAAVLLLMCAGCTSTGTAFMPVGDARYSAKPDGYVVKVFDNGAVPDRPYDVIGVVYTSAEERVLASERDRLIALLRREAAKHGADAIIEIRVADSEARDDKKFEISTTRYRSSEAKAIVFK